MRKSGLIILLILTGWAYPSDAVLTYSRTEIKLSGNPKKIIEKRIKILTQAGRDRYGTQSIQFNEKEEEIKVIYARTITPEGDTIPVPENAINIVSSWYATNYPRFSYIKNLKIAFTGIKPGSELEYRVEVYSKKEEMKSKTSDIFVFREKIPVKEKILEIMVPDSIPFIYRIEGEKISVKEDLKSHEKIYVFVARDLKEFKTDRYYELPPGYMISPYVEFTTYTSWEEVIKEIREKYNEAIEKALAGLENPEEDFHSFYKKVKLISLGYDITGYFPEKIEDAIKGAPSTVPEKAALLSAYLKNSGKIALKSFLFLTMQGIWRILFQDFTSSGKS